MNTLPTKISRLLFSMTFLCIFTLSHAQKNSKKFGKIPMKDMEMSVYDKDSSASAVILFSIGHFTVRDYEFTKHERIKILKPAGTKYGNFTLKTPGKGMIKASCFNLENGEIVEYKLKRSEILEEEIRDDYYVYKLFLPNVKEGSIVEVEYTHPWIPNAWLFQREIPIRYTELLVEPSRYFEYESSFFGKNPNLRNIGTNHWIAHDVAAFKPEPLIDATANHISKVEFEYTKISVPGVYYKEYSTTWPKVSKTLTEDEYFGALLRLSTPYLNSTAKEITAQTDDPTEKMNLAFEFIRSNQRWNDIDYIYATRYYRSNYSKDHVGTAGEINLNLISLLKKLDIEVYPVVLSTIDNGILKPYRASISKLNHVVACAVIDGKEILLDATDKHVIPGVLPPKCLNGNMWLVNELDGRWISPEPRGTSMELSRIEIYSDENNNWFAEITQDYSNYEYYYWKRHYDRFGSDEEYEKYLNEEFSEFELTELALKITPEKMRVRKTMKFDITETVSYAGDEIIINPHLLEFDTQNPFQSDERTMPIDLGHKKMESRNIMIKLPEGITVKSLPESISMSTQGRQAAYQFNSSATENSLSITKQYTVMDTFIPTSEYLVVKTFFSLIIDKNNESIVLTKL